MKKAFWLILAVALCLTASRVALAQNNTGATEAASPIVQAVLFYSPSCPHCHRVIEQDLPPLNEQYGEQLQILGIDTSKSIGQQLYQNTIEQFALPVARQGVPTLVVGDTVLVGSVEIPQMFPQIVAEGIAAGGIGWPDIPGLVEAVPDLPLSADPQLRADTLAAQETAVAANEGVANSSSSAAVALEEIDTTGMAVVETPPADPAGFTLAWLVMAGMGAALVFTTHRLWKAQAGVVNVMETAVSPVNAPLVPVFVVIGLIVAGYLSYVEITHVEAVCGPVGECNIVQSSPYAQILGIPVAVLGVLNYLAVGGLWLWKQVNTQTRLPLLLLLPLTVFGTIFSIYLTFLELFAIHAVCAWCLTSAVITTFLMVIIVNEVTKRPSAPHLSVAGKKVRDVS